MSATIDIVPYTGGMEDDLLDIWNGVIEQDEAFVFTKPFAKDAFVQMLKSQTAVNCAVDGGNVAGFYILHPNFEGRSSHVANASYAVSQRHRGKGVGRLLGQHSLAAARAAGFAAMQFNAVVAANTAANALWQSLGFIKMAEIPEAYTLNSGERTGLVIYHQFL